MSRQRPPSTPAPGQAQLRALVGSPRTFTAATAVPPGRLALSVLEHNGEAWAVIEISPSQPHLLHRLTPAERRVALLAIEGLSNKTIAARCRSSDRTVANQLRSIYGKLGIHSRTELVRALLAAPGETVEPADASPPGGGRTESSR